MSVLARIAELTLEGTNQKMQIICARKGGDAAPTGARYKNTDIEFQIEVERQRRKTEPHTSLEILSIFLVWDLKALKRMSTLKANRLLHKWNGAIR